MKFNLETLPATCGVGVLYAFHSRNNYGCTLEDILSPGNADEAGCGWYVVGFVDSPDCEKFYQECCEKLTLVYQSPVRVNVNSNNEFFFCIFDAGVPDVEEDDDF